MSSRAGLRRIVSAYGINKIARMARRACPRTALQIRIQIQSAHAHAHERRARGRRTKDGRRGTRDVGGVLIATERRPARAVRAVNAYPRGPSPKPWQRFPHPGRPSPHPCRSSPACVARCPTCGTWRQTPGTSRQPSDALGPPPWTFALPVSAVAGLERTNALFCSPLPRSRRGAPGVRYRVPASGEGTPVSAIRRQTRVDARPCRGNVRQPRPASRQPCGGPCPPPGRAFQRAREALQTLVTDRRPSRDLPRHSGPQGKS